MGLFEQWKDLSEKQRSGKEYNEFWNTYLEKEKKIYEYLLEDHDSIVEGTLRELASRFDMDAVVFTGFLDGIDTSLVNSTGLEKINEESGIKLEIDYEKLFWNMLNAKADWLYNLEQWDGVLTEERRNEIKKEFKQSRIAVSSKVGRNEPCPCGSGKKYKKCCGKLM